MTIRRPYPTAEQQLQRRLAGIMRQLSIDVHGLTVEANRIRNALADLGAPEIEPGTDDEVSE